ncbi:MAG: efflux RND transporter permease subunit, partial [Candidatus Aminicenantales bacterium]
ALNMENLNLPAGHIVERHSDFSLRTVGEFKSLDDIRQTIIGATPQGQPIYLNDVAEVKDTLKETRFRSRIQRQKGVFLMINKRSGANTVVTAEAVKKELARIRETLPPDVEFYAAMDQSDIIQRVIRRTGSNALVGGILAVFFIFIFLRNWRPTVAIGLAIPLSIIATFIAFYLAGYTINLLTLGGLALGVGMLVDNAIVVIENIYRHLEEGEAREKAAKVGASEVGMAITASTLTTIAVFFPMVFAHGIVGKLTQGLALAIAFSLLASLFVALTVVPMVASVLFKKRKSKDGAGKNQKKKEFEGAKYFYRKILYKALRRRWLVLGAAFLLLLASLGIVPFLGTGFMPDMDRDMIVLKVKMPVGTSLDETDRVVAMVEGLLSQESEVSIITAQDGSQAEENPADMAGGISTTGTHKGLIWVGLVPKKERKHTDAQILERIRRKLPKLKNVKFEAVDIAQAMMGGANAPVEIKIFGKDIEKLKRIASNVVNDIKDVKGLRDLTHTLAEGKPEYHIRVNRQEASRYGLMVSQVANTIQTASLGKVATRYREGDEEVDIRVRFKKEYRDSLEDIKNIPLLTPLKNVIPLNQVAEITPGVGPIRITRENQARVVTVTANIAGRDLGSVVRDIKKRLNPIEKSLPAGYFIEFGGEYEQMQEAFLIIAGAFALAVLLVYMIMASQFESFVHPFVIMFTIPLAIIGVILALLLTGKSVNLPVLIGFVMLGGIAVNNGIVMVDYINQLKRRGIEKIEAILQGCAVRLRPVLITAFTTILGMTPMALSTSSGAEMRAPMAITVIGGLVATTFLTLFIVPIIYSIVDRVKIKKQ